MNDKFNEWIEKRDDIRERLFVGKMPNEEDIKKALIEFGGKETIEELCIGGLLSEGHPEWYLEEILKSVVSPERFAELKKLVGWDAVKCP